MLLADNETKVDLLNNEAIAKMIIQLLKEHPDRPITIGVHGDWGAGKSSVLEMIEAGFADDKKVLCIKFNGWRFQGFEDAKIALIEGIAEELIKNRSLETKAKDLVAELYKRIDWLKVAKHAGGLALTAATGIPSPDLVHGLVTTLQGYAADPVKLATAANLTAVAEGVQSVLKPAESVKVPAEIQAFRKTFDDLLKKADVEQLVVLIDDLDRCLPDTAIETLEAVRLFVFTPHTAFVVAADEAMIENSVRKHFPELPEGGGGKDYARNYLEKLIHVPFRIPLLGETETRTYVTLLLVGEQLGEGDSDFVKLISVAREKLKRPWQGAVLDATAVNSALGADKSARVRDALILSEQIGPILASGAQGNPRQIKRFVNTLLQRQHTATSRGFGTDIKAPVAAKLLLAERFLPRLYDQIAAVAAIDPEGRCADLAELERRVRKPLEKSERSSKPTKGGGKAGAAAESLVAEGESRLLADWTRDPSYKAWAAGAPELGQTDLRPYLFVAKERKDYFSTGLVLGKHSILIERLMGPRLAVQAFEQEARDLVAADALQVFEVLRGRIVGGDKFDVEPDGMAGVKMLVKVQSSLQPQLLNLLEQLPADRCGPWVVAGWTNIITDSTQDERFKQLRNSWATMPNASALKTAAALARRTN